MQNKNAHLEDEKMDVQSVSLRKSTSRIQQLEHRNIENMITHLEHAV